MMLPRFGLKTVLFQSMELLSSNHLELVTKLCPDVEWLSLDSALFYDLEGLGALPNLRMLRLNYKARPIDQARRKKCLLQGGRSPRRPKFRLFPIYILLCLPHSAWAGGNMTEWADHLGIIGGNNRI